MKPVTMLLTRKAPTAVVVLCPLATNPLYASFEISTVRYEVTLLYTVQIIVNNNLLCIIGLITTSKEIFNVYCR